MVTRRCFVWLSLYRTIQSLKLNNIITGFWFFSFIQLVYIIQHLVCATDSLKKEHIFWKSQRGVPNRLSAAISYHGHKVTALRMSAYKEIRRYIKTRYSKSFHDIYRLTTWARGRQLLWTLAMASFTVDTVHSCDWASPELLPMRIHLSIKRKPYQSS